PIPTKYLRLALTVFAIFSFASASPDVSTQEQKLTVAAVVKAEKANLRDRPSKSGAVVRTVNKGDLLAVVDASQIGPWYRVRDSKTESQAWIHGNTIALLQTTESAPPQRPRLTLPRVSGRSYVNVDGVRVPSPVFSETRPAGTTARCRDGSYSFSQHRRGTCSSHGGVAEWY
ncbi:MAG TPA: DUF3761 domain-containing protein, partial [Pyrinomonadaceae bacterium]|nr:DUF3761 domain-containing protein [Pyrinomonadaceae bacterium]